MKLIIRSQIKLKTRVINLNLKRYTSHVPSILSKKNLSFENSLEEKFLMEYLFLSYKDGSGHTFESLLKKWIVNPIKYGEKASKIALNGYNCNIRTITEKEKESFNRAFGNENFVDEALNLKLHSGSDLLRKYFEVRNYSPAIKGLEYVKQAERAKVMTEGQTFINRSKWDSYFRATTQNELSFMFYVDVSKIKSSCFKLKTITFEVNKWDEDSQIYRHNCQMLEPFEKIRNSVTDQLARFLELCVDKRIQVNEASITYFDILHSTDLKLLSRLITDMILWEMPNWKPLHLENIGWELAKNITCLIQHRYEIETGHIPVLFEVAKHYYQNLHSKNVGESHKHFYRKLWHQIDIKNVYGESVPFLPVITGFRIANTILRRIVGTSFRFRNMPIFEKAKISNLYKSNSYNLFYIQINGKLKNYFNESIASNISMDNGVTRNILMNDETHKVSTTPSFVSLRKMPQITPLLPFLDPLTPSGMIFDKNYPISNIYEPTLINRLSERSPHYSDFKYIDVLNILNNIPMNFDPGILQGIETMKTSGKELPKLPVADELMTPDQVMKLFAPENDEKSNDFDFLQNCLSIARRYLNIINLQLSSLEYNKKALRIAKEFCPKTPFYISYQCDYRGRYFPKNYINHHSTDVIRSLFRFNEKKFVDKNGLDSLKVHLYTSKYGKDRTGKLTQKDYINHIDQNIHNVIDSANSYQVCDWWRETNPNKCWQVLSICIEIKNALENPQTYKSSYPVKIDIGASLITHLSLLLKDENLVKMSSLNKIFQQNSIVDLYEYFTCKVKENFDEIMNQDLELFKFLYPEIIEKKLISPSLLKPLILKSILSPSFKRHNPNFSLYEMNSFIKENPQFINLSRTVFNELDLLVTRTSFDEAFSIITSFKTWLWDMAENICSDKRFPSWYSPSGMHVMPIFVNKQSQNLIFDWMTNFENVDDCVDINKQDMSPKKLKYINSFLPNIIDSLDSALFTNVVLACKKENITVMGVHDSYWTHPSDIKRLQQIIKQEIYLMYDQPVLERIYNDLNENLSPKAKYKIPFFKHVGNFDLKILKDSDESICF